MNAIDEMRHGLIIGVFVWGVLTLLVFLMSLTGHDTMAGVCFLALSWWTPTAAWWTWRRAKRAWVGEPVSLRDDMGVPAAATFTALWIALLAMSLPAMIWG